MTYESAVAWSIVRSLLAGGLCWGLARGTSPLARPNGPMGPFHVLLLVPFFMPGLVVGYAYRNASLSLVQTPLLNELLYLAIIVAQFTPVVVLVLEWLPAAALGPSGVFLLKQAQRSGRRVPLGERLRAMLAGELPRQLTAAALAALLCFQEVEVATLMQARGWAEWIFTKQAGGVELLEVLPFLVLPVGYGLMLTVPVLGYWTWERLPACQVRVHSSDGGTLPPLPRERHQPSQRTRCGGEGGSEGDIPLASAPSPRPSPPQRSLFRKRHRLWGRGSREDEIPPIGGGTRHPWTSMTGWKPIPRGWCIIVVSWLLVFIWPVTSLAIGAFRGAGVIQFRSALWQEIGDALVLGVTVTLGLWLILWSVDRLGRRGPGGRGSRRAATAGGHSHRFSAFCSLSPTIGSTVSDDSTVGERGPCSWVDPLTLSLSPAAESSMKATSIAGERGPETSEGGHSLVQAARQEPRPPAPRPPEYAVSDSGGDRSRPMSHALARERPAGTGRIAHPTVAQFAWVAALLPGLLGSLALGLTIFEICQRLGVQPSYSPVPLVVGMVLFLLPRALAMQAMLRRNEQQAGVFVAESLAAQPGERGRQGAAILWRIRDAGRFWTLALLFWWSYLELTLPALLRPAGMAPAPQRLYNFLHYGHIDGVAAMLAVVLLVPVFLLTVGKGIWMRMDGLSTEER